MNKETNLSLQQAAPFTRPRLSRTRSRPPPSAPDSSPFYPKIRTHIPGCLPTLLQASLSPPLCPPISPEHPTISILLPLNRPSLHTQVLIVLPQGNPPLRPQPFPTRRPPRPAPQPDADVGGGGARTSSPFPSSAHPPLPSGPGGRPYLSLPGSSRQLSRAGGAGRAGEGVGIGRRERGEGDSGRGPGVGRLAAAAPPLIEPIGPPQPGSRLRGRVQAAEIVEGVDFPSALLSEAAADAKLRPGWPR